jgi:GNAT superfamily N-acetyltransferase
LIRPIRPGDKEALRRAHGLLSRETIYRRFLSAKPRLTAADLRYLTEVDGVNHIALIAEYADHPGWIAGVARCVRFADDPETAEFAIVVGDALQRRGLGTKLAEAVAEAARLQGIRRFSATALADNDAARHLIGHISARLVADSTHHGLREVVSDLGERRAAA